MNMLEYSKTILSKVNFDTELLEKELEKAVRNINRDERISYILTYARSMPGNQSGSLSTEEVSSVRKKTTSQQRAWTPDELELK